MRITYVHPKSSCQQSGCKWMVDTVSKNGLAVAGILVCEFCGVEPERVNFESLPHYNYDLIVRRVSEGEEQNQTG